VLIVISDIYDSMNYVDKKGRDYYSFGNAIVIELLDRFLWECTRTLNLPKMFPTSGCSGNTITMPRAFALSSEEEDWVP
jgi:hypothetical protein